ncbi:Retrovirus-related Pol polyprotein from transposon 412 [Vitis vinifera]|uniref:Retrovirus-related Pol polyprotein from transposon 412 n=1 Tax=Vitis vinifera TaxID=29760 RepID=A0A438FRJ0_VITVI|nr:Retrovirus-related Pol polyprotein from transposon 412 [Vitis vinifera]
MGKRDKNASEILEVLRQVKVNIPLLDMIKQVPTYAKFLKDLCTIKRGLNVNKKAFLTEQVSAIIQCKSPLKYKDPDVLPFQLERREEILPLFNKEEAQEAAKEETPKLNLKPLPMELKYTYLEENKQCPVVISSSLTTSGDVYLKFSRGEEAKPIRQPQRRLNPHLQEVVRAEVLKLLQAGIIYPYLTALGKYHFPLPFIDQVLERVSGHPFYCFLDGYSGYFQIEIDVEDQEKTTFTCPFGTYAYRRMPFGLCNAPATFQRCMLVSSVIWWSELWRFSWMTSPYMGSTFEECLVNLEAVLNRCIEKDLVLNWEKCHFMVHQGIVLGHIISEKGIEVDKAKVELIVKLPSPTTVKGVRQFLGHAGFYRRFIKDFSKLSKPLCELLAKDAKFIWDERCQKSFDQLKQFLTTSNRAVLGQREDGKPYVIYYASKTLNEAQRNYTTTEKELDKKGVENVVADHLSRKTPWYAHIANYLVTGEVPNQIIRKCVPEEEQQGILSHCHENACGGHFASQKTTMKVLQSGFTWPSLFKDAHTCVGA